MSEVTKEAMQALETKILKQVSENLSSTTLTLSSLQETIAKHEVQLSDTRKILVLILNTVKTQQNKFGLSLVPKGAKIYGVEF